MEDYMKIISEISSNVSKLQKIIMELSEENANLRNQIMANGKLSTNVMDIRIDKLNLSNGAYKCLSRKGMETVRDIIEYHTWQYVRGLGAKYSTEVIDVLEKLGLENEIPKGLQQRASRKKR